MDHPNIFGSTHKNTHLRLLSLLLMFLATLSSATILEVRVSDDNDDAEETIADGSIDRGSSDLELVYDGSTGQAVGIRFKSISIPRDSNITQAYIQFTVDEIDSKDTDVLIYAEETDDASAYSSTDLDITSRAKTSASVPWSIPVWGSKGTSGTDQRTPDLTALIQGVVNRSGWSSGNDIAFIIEAGSGCSSRDCQRTAESYDGSASQAPLLHIEYTSSGIDDSCDDTLDTSTNDSCPGTVITFLDGVTTDTTGCITGSSEPSDPEFYKFTAGTHGTLDLTTSSPNDHDFHMSVGTSCDGEEHYPDTTAQSHLIPTIALSPGETIYFYVKETGSDTDEYKIDFDFTLAPFAANDDTANVNSNSSVTIAILDNDSPGQGEMIDTGSVIMITDPTNGSVVINADGSVNYTPDTDFGGSDSFTYTVDNSAGTTSNTATVSIDIGLSGGERDFTVRNPLGTRNIIGNFKIGGNINLCATSSTGYPWSDGCKSSQDLSNSTHSVYVDGDSDASTVNSSSFELDLAAGSEVVWAGLYWQGHLHNSDESKDFMDDETISGAPEYDSGRKGLDLSVNSYEAEKVLFSIKGEAYQEVTATQLDFDGLGYGGFVEVTSLLDLNDPNGVYWLADIKSHQGMESDHGNFAAWSLVIIYSNPNEEYRNITLFDGYTTVDSGYSRDLVIDGFLTSKVPPIESKLAFFSLDGDGGTNSLTVVSPSKGATQVSGPDNPADSLFNSTIQGVNNRVPDHPSLRLDLDILELTDVLGPFETSAILQPRTTGDRYTASYFIMSTQLYVPKFCYDYSYQQNNRFFTEDNNGTSAPFISGVVDTDSDVTVSIYIRNQEETDITAEDLTMDINDINTSMATYVPDSVEITFPNEVIPFPILDSALSVGNAAGMDYIHDIALSDIDGTESIYTYYKIRPTSNELNISLDIEITYTMIFTDAYGGTAPMTYTSILGGPEFPMCTGANFSYDPQWSIFNVVDTELYDQYSAYTIPTQVAKRPTSFDVVSFDPDAVNTEKHVTSLVGIELIDAGAYHDINASCNEPSSAISPRVWVFFDDNGTKKSFDSSVIDLAIKDGYVSDQVFSPGASTNIKSAADFYAHARENVAFRVVYNVHNDSNESLLQVIRDPNDPKYIRIDNFSNLTDTYGKHCKQLVKNPNNNVLTDLVATACSNNGNNSTEVDLAICMECLFGYNTRYICSRDNFSIRPESFNIKLSDGTKDANATTAVSFATDHTGVQTPVVGQVDMASGYPYRFDLNSTSHIDNSATPGYTRSFTPVFSDDNATFVWSPGDPGAVAANCNDTNSKEQIVDFVNGIARTDLNVTQVGEYLFQIVDSSWTQVDWDPDFRSHHHEGGGTNDAYFIDGADCVIGNSDVQSSAQATSSGTTLYYNGCLIKSEHTNSDADLLYKDYDILFHPYTFDLSDIDASYGVGANPDLTNSWLYMNNMADDDANQSFHLRGDIAAISADGTTLSNFVSGCYARDIKLTLENNAPASAYPDVPAHTYRFFDTNATDILADINSTLTSTGSLLTLTDGNFTKSMAGVTTIDLNSNFTREVNNSVNPFTVTFGDFDIACDDPLECQMQADLDSSFLPEGNLTLNSSLTYYYGRVHAPRYRINDSTGTVDLYYEIYCDPNTNINPCQIGNPTDHNVTIPNRILSIDDIRWYRNEAHTSEVEGDINASLPPRGIDDLTVNSRVAYDQATFTYDESKGYPYKTKIQVPSDSWLIYNKFDAAARVNFFELEFNSAGSVAGKHIGVSSSDSNASINTNRRIQW